MSLRFNLSGKLQAGELRLTSLIKELLDKSTRVTLYVSSKSGGRSVIPVTRMSFVLKAPFEGIGALLESSEVETVVRYNCEALYPLDGVVEREKKSARMLPKDLINTLPDDALSRAARGLRDEILPLLTTDSLGLDRMPDSDESPWPMRWLLIASLAKVTFVFLRWRLKRRV